MAQLVQVLTTEPEDMSSIPSTYMEKRTDPLKVFSNLHTYPHSMCTHSYAHTCTHTVERVAIRSTRAVPSVLPKTYVKKQFIQ